MKVANYDDLATHTVYTFLVEPRASQPWLSLWPLGMPGLCSVLKGRALSLLIFFLAVAILIGEHVALSKLSSCDHKSR